MKARTLLVLALLVVCSADVYAQQARNGTNAAPQLLIAVDAKNLGGGAVATATGIESVLWNPAGLDLASGDLSFMVARRNYIADIGVNFASVGLRFGRFGSLAVHMRNFDIGEIEETDELNMDGTGETFKPTFFTLGATYSRALTDRISFGLTSNLNYESFANVGASGVSFDAGVQYRDFLNLTGLQVGVAIRNIGTAMQYDGSALFREAVPTDSDRAPTKYKVEAGEADMPTVVDIGVSYLAWRGLNLSVTYMENTYGPSEIRAVANYDFMGYLQVRGAFMQPVEDQSELESIFEGFAFGGTLNLQQVVGINMALDYGYIPVKYFSANHLFTLRGSF